ncbi:uncharacterized protein V6R79_009164 [Siganus canaliculatus]
MDAKNPKLITPVEVVRKNNPLVNDIEKMSKKWHKRWPDIDQPWPVEGTLNPDVIKSMQVLVSVYKVDQKKGKKGQKRKEKRQRELGLLQLFENEGQKLIKVVKEKKDKAAEIIQKSGRDTEKLLAEINTPYSHVTPIKNPPPYEKEVKFKEIYPQLPVISQEGNYQVINDNDQVIETGKAETTIKMYPSVKRKTKSKSQTSKGSLRVRRMQWQEDDQSDSEENRGGYDPVVRSILAKAEKRGEKSWSTRDVDNDSSNESQNGSSNEDSEDEDLLKRFYPVASSTSIGEDRRQALRGIEKSIEQCLFDLDISSNAESRKALGDQLEELQIAKKQLQGKDSKKLETKTYTLRKRKDKTPDKMCPVIIRGQNLEYKPWQHTDMSDILEKLPILQDGAHPWISKLEEIMVGTHPAIGDIKRLLANLLGVPAMEEIFEKAGLTRYVASGEEVPRSQSREADAHEDGNPEQADVHEDSCPQDPEEEVASNVDRDDSLMHDLDRTRNVCATNEQERTFDEIDLQYAPTASESEVMECEAPQTPQGSDVISKESEESIRQRSPRPVRTRVKPKRYQDQKW